MQNERIQKIDRLAYQGGPFEKEPFTIASPTTISGYKELVSDSGGKVTPEAIVRFVTEINGHPIITKQGLLEMHILMQEDRADFLRDASEQEVRESLRDLKRVFKDYRIHCGEVNPDGSVTHLRREKDNLSVGTTQGEWDPKKDLFFVASSPRALPKSTPPSEKVSKSNKFRHPFRNDQMARYEEFKRNNTASFRDLMN